MNSSNKSREPVRGTAGHCCVIHGVWYLLSGTNTTNVTVLCFIFKMPSCSRRGSGRARDKRRKEAFLLLLLVVDSFVWICLPQDLRLLIRREIFVWRSCGQNIFLQRWYSEDFVVIKGPSLRLSTAQRHHRSPTWKHAGQHTDVTPL